MAGGDVSPVAMFSFKGIKYGITFLLIAPQSGALRIGAYDKLWASVMKAVPKLDESESGQMVLK